MDSAETVRLRPIDPDDALDVAEVLRINEENVEVLAPMDEAKLRRKQAIAERFDVIEVGGRIAGFVVVYAPTAGYWSENFAWFSGRYDDFLYLDRIALDPQVRRLGVGSHVYAELEALAAPRGRMTLEAVDTNAGSLAFHARRGYAEVGRLTVDGHPNVMMVKEL
ncbi:MAG: GNAT family N-acetyltransferase [Nocardioides sp.]|uniref:GNAT family N-acetyltransferase n=1 Tax=Nocardioides sp. TaxID=35761 RepID=UPI0039E6A7C2